MFDFALTQSGDLVFIENKEKHKPLRIDFVIANAGVKKISFKIEDSLPLQKSKNGMSILFDVKETINNKKAMTINGASAKSQAIKIRLRTTLGELAERKNIGSKLELAKHKPLYLEATAATVTEYVKEAIKDILPDAEVRVTPITTTNMGYHQTMHIYIYNKGFLIFKYELKG
jgi:phage baseplate assembly protein W